MGRYAPWGNSFIHNQNNYQNIDKKTKMISCWNFLDHSLNNYEGLTLCPFCQNLPTQLQTKITWGTALNAINLLIARGAITKTGTLAMTFHKPAGEANQYVRFGYGPLSICNHTQGQVLGSMNTDPINMIHTSQQSTKEGLNKELEGDFRSSILILQRTILDE